MNLSQINHMTLLDAALAYADMGLRVFPCRQNGKQPMPGLFWQQAGTTDKVTILDWWVRYPNANIGIAMGDGWHALDLDRGEGKDGWKSFLALGGPERPPWPMQATPGGGGHLLWRLPGVSFKNFTRRGVFSGMDMRSDSGYILGAPSVVDGKRYR
jgi:putative DNA primase/helicase